MNLLFLISVRNLFRQRVRSLLTGISLICGYLILSLSMSVSEGSYSNIIEIFTRAQTGHVQIHSLGFLDKPSLYKRMDYPGEFSEKLGSYKYAPRIIGPALAYSNGKSSPVSVRGIDPILEQGLTEISDKIKTGKLFGGTPNEEGYYGVLVGYTAAKLLKLKVGDELVLISQGADGSVANDAYFVSGIIGGNDTIERQNVYLPLLAAQDFFSMHGQIHEIALRTEGYYLSDEVKKTLSGQFPKLEVATWQQVEHEFHKAMTMDKNSNIVSLAIIVLVVAIGVLNTILMSTLERTREYGVQKALGTRPFFLFMTIMLESLFLCVMSLIAGMLVTLPVNYWFATVGVEFDSPIEMGGMKFTHLMGEISTITMIFPALFMLLAVLIFALYPAIRAARLTPLDAMRSN